MTRVSAIPDRDKRLPREVDILDLFGTRVSFGPDRMIEMLRQPVTQIFLLLVFILLVVTDPPGLHGSMSLGTLLGIWFMVLSLFHLVVWLGLLGLVSLGPRLAGRGVYRSVLFVPAGIVSIHFGEWITAVATHGLDPVDPFFPKGLVYLVISEIFGIMYFRMVCTAAPSAETDAPERPVTEAVPDHRQIVIGAAPVAVRDLRLLEAREHHVHVTLEGQTLTQRARLSDIVAQTRPEDGLQPHRSWWVAARTARRLERDGQKHVLCLDDGTRVPVARTRLDEVRNWLDRHG